MTENNEEKIQKTKWYKYKKGVTEDIFQTGFSSTGLNQTKAKKQIQRYLLLGVFVSVFSFIGSLAINELETEASIMAAAIFVISAIFLIGIYRKAKWAAISFLTLYIVMTVVNLIDGFTLTAGGAILRLIIVLVFFQGTMAIIKWPKLQAEQEKTV